MKKTTGKDKLQWIQTKTFYGVMAALIIAIIGVAAAIYNVAKVRNLLPGAEELSTVYSIPEQTKGNTQPQANANVTNIPDERDETKTTINDLNHPYSGYFLLPLNSNVIKDYSDSEMIFSETMNDWRSHNGIDIKGKVGDKAIAIQDGKILEVTSDEIWGDTVVIQHGNGLKARYCGVKATVRQDAVIEQGQVIGTVTAIPIEESEGVHIHLETEVDGKIVDPIKALNLLGEPIADPNE